MIVVRKSTLLLCQSLTECRHLLRGGLNRDLHLKNEIRLLSLPVGDNAYCTYCELRLNFSK